MWNSIAERLRNYPERLAVARVLVENGLGIRDRKIFCNEIEVPVMKLARVAKVDRRTVMETLQMISDDKELGELFQHIRSAGLSLREIARHLGLGVVEITPDDPRTVGILASSASIIAEAGISIRQALVDDPELNPEPRLTLITEKTIPGDVIAKILKVRGVKRVFVS